MVVPQIATLRSCCAALRTLTPHGRTKKRIQDGYNKTKVKIYLIQYTRDVIEEGDDFVGVVQSESMITAL